MRAPSAHREHLRGKVGGDLGEVDRALEAKAAEVLDGAREGIPAAKSFRVGHEQLTGQGMANQWGGGGTANQCVGGGMADQWDGLVTSS